MDLNIINLWGVLMSYIVGTFEAIIYLLFLAYSVYIPIKSRINKKKLSTDHNIIINPQNAFTSFVSKAVLFLSLPSILLMFTLIAQEPEENKIGIYVYFGIFLCLMYLGNLALTSSKGDYYIDETGIHFVANEKNIIRYEDIQKSKWLDYAHIEGADTTTILLVKGKKIKLYNLLEEQYLQYISKENIFTPKHEAVKSIYKKSFTIITIALFFISVIISSIYFSYTSHFSSASALTETEKYSYEQLLNDNHIPHYLINHGEVTEVSYKVWKNVLIIEKTMFVILMIICFIINMIWKNQIFRKRYV